MEGAAFAAQSEAIVFLSYFADFPDPRQRGKVVYPLNEILLLCLLAVLAGAETFVDIARFGQKKITLLRRFLPFQDGTPSHDHLGDIFATLDATQFQRRFVAWVAKLIGVSADVIAFDGKTLRGSAHKKRGKAAIHMVSAFAARQRLVLGQVKVADKSNEIVAIPALLDMLAIEGAIVTIDAMGCQRNIAQKILDKKADYIFSLKGNQSSLREDVELFAAEQKANGFRDTKITQHQTVDGETRFYVTSLLWVASLLGPAIRAHWMVENGLHWVMDMMFRDDECRIRTDHAPANFTTIKHIALNLLRRARGKDSLRLRRKVAAWDDDFLASLIAASAPPGLHPST